MKIDVVPPSALSADELARWSALQAAQPAWDSPFLSPGWALAAEQRQPRDGGVRVAVLREAGRAVGFFPVRVAGAVAMPAGAPMNDYQALVAEPWVMIDPRRLAQALGVDRLDFSHMLIDQTAFAPYVRGTNPSFVIELPDGYAAYAAGRRAAGSGVIKDIDKRRRKIEREAGPVRFTAHQGCSEALDQLLAWKSRQYRATGQTDLFAVPWTVELLCALFQSRAEGFGGGLFTLHVGDKLAAAQFNLLGRHTIHAWIIAHDEEFERYSPGLLLFQDILKWMEGAGYRALDLGAGDYRFKRQLANVRRPVAHGFVGRLSPATLLRQAQYGVCAAAERLPLGPVSQFPAKAMRRLDLWRGLR
ncbi:MAG: GNAT family N-acetyltransferase [Caulobacteraceae bacterium]|nr:GNAT family N-acetyltransferase [Caulobacteraceae bacterium]